MTFLKLLKLFLKRTYIFLIVLGIYFTISIVMTIYCENIPVCPFKLITGLPCPGCGLTRAFMALFTFNFLDSFRYHPLWPLVIFMLLVLFLEPIKGFHRMCHSRWFWLGNGLIFVLTYVIRMIYIFPNYPLDYFSNNLINFLKSLLL